MILLTSFMISWWGNQRSNHVYVSLLLSIWLRGCNYWRLGMTGATHDDRSHVSCPPLMSRDGLWLADSDHVTRILTSDWLVPPLMSRASDWLTIITWPGLASDWLFPSHDSWWPSLIILPSDPTWVAQWLTCRGAAQKCPHVRYKYTIRKYILNTISHIGRSKCRC